MTQKIYPDPYGLDVWDQDRCGWLQVHLVSAREYRALTGREPPGSPISAATYAHYGLPWFELADESKGDVPPSESLGRVKSVGEIDVERGRGTTDPSVEIDSSQIRKLRPLPDEDR